MKRTFAWACLLGLVIAELCPDQGSYCLGTCANAVCCPLDSAVCGTVCCAGECWNEECQTLVTLPAQTLAVGAVISCVDSLNVLQTEVRLIFRNFVYGYYGRVLQQIWFLMRYYPWFKANCED